MIDLSFFKGPGIVGGLLGGLVLGILTGKIVTFLLLGLMFGIFSEDEYDADHMTPRAKRRNAQRMGTSDA